MIRHPSYPTVLIANLTLALLLAPAASGQTAPPEKSAKPAPPPAAGTKAAADPEALELSPFVVEASRDDSYGVMNSNSITSFNTELEKLPISADVINKAFMDDTNSTTLENMLREYSAGAGTGSAAGDPGGIPVNMPLDRGGGDSVSAGVQLRGLGAAVVKQDGFMLPSPAGTGLNSNFGTERVEVINGPQALLYGNGGGGGVVNVISKQARFGRKQEVLLKFQTDEYGHSLAQADYSIGRGRMALVISLLHQELGDSRDFIGGPLRGIYGQFAFKLFDNTVVRLTGKRTMLDRFNQQQLTLSATSTAVDGRHGQTVRYLLATDQMEKSATGNSGAGVIGNGHITWDNVDSYGNADEYTTANLGHLQVETKWRPWLTTQLSAGYQNKDSKVGVGSGIVFYMPTHASNPLPGEWTVGNNGSAGASWSNQPSRSYSVRLSALLSNKLFNGRADSQTIIGGELTEGNYANENHSWFEVDGNGNLVRDANGQRIQLENPHPYWSVSNGPVENPFFPAATPKITYQGKNYVSQVINETDPSLITPENPQGVTGTDLYIHSRAYGAGAYAVNFTQWGDGRLATLMGLRWVTADNRQFASTAIPEIRATGENLSYSIGANYAVKPWLRPYFALSDTYNLPGILLTVPADPYGNPAPISHSVGQEVGLKLSAWDGRLSGSIAFYAVQTTDDPYAIPTQLRDSINPAGINGRHLGATGSVIKVDRKSQGMQVAITAAPTKNWRMRLSAALIEGTIGNDTSYAPLYNDQFYANSQGQVTYANGVVVYVRPTALATPGTAANPGYIPLTIAKLSTPGDPYYANPDPITGLLRSTTGRNVLLYTASPNGPIRTNVTGLPITALQVTGIVPPDQIVTSRAGDHTTGYPKVSFSFTSVYTISRGAFKGLKFGGTLNGAWKTIDFYYYENGYSPTATRTPLYRPTKILLNALLGYDKRFKKVTWSTQLNVNNVFDDYDVFFRPNNIAGFSGTNTVVWTNQPCEWAVSTSFKF
jgi:outer membrane receptor protein involved in Fe transport